MKNPNTFLTKDGVPDASLLPASRDLYEALKAFIDYHATLRGDEAIRCVLEAQGCAALAKARGEI